MREVESTHPAGTIGVLVGPLVRYRAIFTSLEKLHVPKGTTLLFMEGVDIAQNCNKLVEGMIGDWLWIMGDDHSFDPDLLLNLLARKVEIVVPVVCMRGKPFTTVTYKKAVPGGHDNPRYTWRMLSDEYPQGGLMPVAAAGSAGMLVRRWVFDAMCKPWFEYTRHTSEDINFCLNAKASGYTVYMDLDQAMTHITPANLEPVRDATGQWRVMVSIDGHKMPFIEVEAP